MQRKRVVLFVITLVVLTSVLLALPSLSAADKLSDTKAQARQAIAQLEKLSAKVEVVIERYNAATAKLSTINAKIAQNQRNLQMAKYNLALAKTTLQKRAVDMYKQRSYDMLDVLLATKSFDELLTQLDMMNRVTSNDANVVTSIDQYRQTIAAARTALVSDRKDAEALVAERTSEKQQIEGALSHQKSIVAGLQSQIKQIQRQQSLAAQQTAQQSGGGFVPPGGGGNPGPANGGVVAIAQQYLGVPYVWGGASPSGFDCSGFTMYVYAQVGVSLPHNAAAQAGCGTWISDRSQLQPGDLVFFGNPIHHVGLYVGGGTMIHAPYTGASVSYSGLLSDYVGGCRP